MTGYRLWLDDDDVQTIFFVGDRYCWSAALGALEAGDNELTEVEAWEIVDAFERDTEGGHAPFPMLDQRSNLCVRLQRLWDSVV
jgi:hypothetical protein